MSGKLLLSFVVPVYNVEKYLNECLDSIFDPSADEDEYEVIAVNDGSTDNSPEILKTYERYRNFRIITQENAGLGFARNSGIRAATGRYIAFIDSDDYLLPGAVPVLLDLARGSDCDIVEFGFETVDDASGERVAHTTEPVQGIESGKSFLIKKIMRGNYTASACNKIYKKKYLDANSLYFLKLRRSEDVEWESRCYFYAESVSCYPVLLFAYRRRQGSIITSAGNTGQCYAMIELVDALNNFRESIDFDNEDNLGFLSALGDQIAFFLDTAINMMYKYYDKSARPNVFLELKKRRHLLALAARRKGRRMYKLTRLMPARAAFRMYKII